MGLSFFISHPSLRVLGWWNFAWVFWLQVLLFSKFVSGCKTKEVHWCDGRCKNKKSTFFLHVKLLDLTSVRRWLCANAVGYQKNDESKMNSIETSMLKHFSNIKNVGCMISLCLWPCGPWELLLLTLIRKNFLFFPPSLPSSRSLLPLFYLSLSRCVFTSFRCQASSLAKKCDKSSC